MDLNLNVRRMRNTKIIATLGPSSSRPDQIRALFESGADVFRLNLSHGTHADHRNRYDAIRALEKELGRSIGVLLDLQGPKLRLGVFAEGKETLSEGQTFRLDLDPTPGDGRRAQLPHPEIFAALRSGLDVLVDGGKIRLRVTSCAHDHAETLVMNAGVLSNRKGVNVPGTILPLSALTDKDRKDLALGLELGVDWIALSFVQRPEDIRELKAIVNGRAAVMAKLEKPSAIESLEAIVEESDAVMVARGDLGVELPPEQVPILQKRIVRVCREAGKPVVVATQMLESMVGAPTPTRAEASDVATAVYDGADAVMLSAESASGAYPVDAVEIMDRIIACVEGDTLQRKMMHAVSSRGDENATDAICAAIRTVAEILPATATVAYTSTGATTLRVAHQRPRTPILSLSPDRHVSRKLTLAWGVHSICSSTVRNIEEMVAGACIAAKVHGFSANELPIVIVAGTPFGVSGSTNLMRIVWPGTAGAELGDVVASSFAAKRTSESVEPVRMRDPYFSHDLSE